MVKILLYDFGKGSLDVEKEFNIDEEFDEYLMGKIPDIEFEATDNVADMDDNWIYWFSSKNELKAKENIVKLLSSIISPNSRMKYEVTIEEF